jgi:hypothetical protein
MTPAITAHLQIWAGALTVLFLILLLERKNVYRALRVFFLFLIFRKSCYWCKGTGRTPNDKLFCETCHGKGSINLFKTIFIK